jgi:hypothetical protein
MPIATPCSEQGCNVLTIGHWCIEHDRAQAELVEPDSPFARRPPARILSASRLVRRGSAASRGWLHGASGVIDRFPSLDRARSSAAAVSRSSRRVGVLVGAAWTACDGRVRPRLQP